MKELIKRWLRSREINALVRIVETDFMDVELEAQATAKLKELIKQL